jgi:uncharacterized protein
MLKPLTDPVDVGLLSASESTGSSEYPLAGFERLKDSLAKSEGTARVEFRFHDVDATSSPGDVPEASSLGRFPALDGGVEARPWLVCQRCLNPFEWHLESAFKVAFVGSEEEAAQVPVEYDAVLAPHGRASLRELVEDELLLALPLVPMHERIEECRAPPGPSSPEDAPDEDAKEATTRPFAQLRDLLDRR